jgi:Uma2 family endonuclease
MRVQVDAASSYFYPDVVVTCSAADKARHTFKTEPKLIIEVLSPSTAAYDRGAKFSHFRQLASLQEYVLIDIDARTADVFRLGADGLWVLHPFAKDAEVTLASVDLAISAAQLFAEVDSD